MLDSNTANQLLARHPAAVVMWLDEWLKQGNRISLDSDFNWLGLAESADAYACNTYEKHTVLERILWGNVAITVRETLNNNATNGGTQMFHAMAVRHNLILQLGHHAGDPICDSSILVDWFYRELPVSLEEATKLAQNWQSNPTGRKHEFKWVVERLKLLQNLAINKKLNPDPELSRWLGLLEILNA